MRHPVFPDDYPRLPNMRAPAHSRVRSPILPGIPSLLPQIDPESTANSRGQNVRSAPWGLPLLPPETRPSPPGDFASGRALHPPAYPLQPTRHSIRGSGDRCREHTDIAVSYTHLRAHETVLDLVCRLLLEK